jgi:CRP/FNR family transcriptional regulator, cyclic AMP receptor protein
MSLREIIPLLPEARQSQVKAGQSIFNLGDTGYVMYFILDGEVAITTAENQKIDHLTTGDIFGEMALVDNQVRSANAMALTDITLAIIDQKGFNDLAQQLPTFATDVMASPIFMGQRRIPRYPPGRKIHYPGHRRYAC